VNAIVLGWEVLVLRRLASSPPDETDSLLLASWTTGPFGLRWLNELVKGGHAIDLGGNGYPDRYSIRADVLLPIITAGSPPNASPPVVGDDYFLPKGWNRQVKLDRQRISECSGEEQLLIEAWDRS
jgi:hypothetical protein